MSPLTITKYFKCLTCDKLEGVTMDLEKYQQWRRGERIQYVFPDLSDDTRELMISNTCGTCFDNMHKEEANESTL